MMYSFIFFFLAFILFSGKLQAQSPPSLNPLTDSLRKELATVTGKERVTMLNAIAWEYRNIEPAEALKYVVESIGVAYNIGFRQGLANAYRTKASIHWNMSEFAIATENALLGLQIFETLKDSLGIANSYLILGNIYNQQKNIPFGIDYYEKALQIYTSLRQESRKAACLNNLADILTQKGDYEKATEYVQKALAINQVTGNNTSLVHNLNNIGYLFYKQGFLDSALLTIQKSEKMIIESKDKSLQIILQDSYLTSSYIYFEQKEYAKSITYAQKSLEIAEKIKNREKVRDSYKQLAAIHSLLNHIEQAYLFQRKYIALNDSIFSQENVERIAQAQVQYETANKEKQIQQLESEKLAQDVAIKKQQSYEILLISFVVFSIAIAFVFYQNQRNQKKINLLLASKNEEIEQQKKELERINQTKDKFFSIVAHDLKSPINSLIGFANLLANYAEGMSIEEIKKIANDLNQSVNNTLDLTNNLLTWARLQMESIEYKPAHISLSQAVNQQITLFSPIAEAKANQITSSIHPNLYVLADEYQLDFVLRNLVTNALKFTQKGQISISALAKDDMVEIAIQDTGIGMSADFMQRIFDVGHKSSTQGTAGEKGTGLGLPLCKEFIEKNGGKIWVESTENKGSTFRFSLKKIIY